MTDDFPHISTLNGKWDARCMICMHPVYRLWADKVPPPAGCPQGHLKPHECSNAMAREEMTAQVLKLGIHKSQKRNDA